MENWLWTKTVKTKECDHYVLHVGSANSAQVVSKYDIKSAEIKKYLAVAVQRKKYFWKYIRVI